MPSTASRRALLRTVTSAVAVGLAGCTAPLGARRQTDGDPALRRIEVADRDAVPDDDVELDVAMLESAVTTDHTAHLRVAFTNTAAEARRFTFGSGPPFTRFWNVEPADGPELLLLSADDDLEKVAAGSRRPSTDVVFVARDVLRTLTLDPDETLAVEKAVWDSNRNPGDDCLAAGAYRFENDYGLPDGTTFTWGFTLAVERP